ncbi:MAG: hypothetical protein K9K79_04695 [Desulfohalobiaceae bacterium]|nr:hypothetical protein [Desulfohalobiaceae bacterium]
MGLVPGGAHNNREFREADIRFTPQVKPVVQDVLYDPQTSGGLFICVRKDQAESLFQALQVANIASTALIGEVLDNNRESLRS